MHFLVLRERSHRVPLEAPYEGDSSGIVRRVGHDRAEEVRKLFAIAEGRRGAAEGDLGGGKSGVSRQVIIVYPHITLLELCSSRELFWPNFPSPRGTPSPAETPSSSCSGYKWRERIDRPRLPDHTLRAQSTMWEFETVIFGWSEDTRKKRKEEEKR